MTTAPDFAIDERTARQLVLLKALETADDPLWPAADRDWATRVARASLDEHASPGRLMVERCRHAMQRLAARDAGLRTLIESRLRLAPWILAALALGLGLGLALDRIGPTQQVDLLAPPIWALVAWNVVVVLLVLVAPLRRPGGGRLRRALAALWRARAGRGDARQRFAADWLKVSAPLDLARAAVVLHLAAAAVVLGLLGGLYLRGLVLDYRAGWQSTFLGPDAVHTVLHTLLAPASALTGIVLPDAATLATLRVDAEHPAAAPAAPWLHLYAATLGLFVLAPRLVLALLAATQVLRFRRRLPLPLRDPWFQQWLHAARVLAGTVWLLPHAAALPADAALRLQAALDGLAQGRARLQVAPAVPYGDETDAARCRPPPGAVAVLVAVDLATTPEAEVQGRLLDTVAGAAGATRRLLLVDQAALRQRFGAADPRLDERRQAWERLAQAHGTPMRLVDLDDDAVRLQAVLAPALT